MWEWQDGFKSIDGRLYFPPDNDFTLPEAQWPASSLYLDATAGPGDRNGAADSGDIVVSDRITKYSETPTPVGGTDSGDLDYAYNPSWTGTAVAATFDNLVQAVRQQAAQLLIAPKLTSGGSVLFSTAKGAFWSRNYGERLPFRGGSWNNGAYAGLAALHLTDRRSNVSGYVGCRPALPLSQRRHFYGKPCVPRGKGVIPLLCRVLEPV